MENNQYVLISILLAGVITFGLRSLPFIAGRWLRRHAIVQKLGDSLPLSIMVLLLLDTVNSQANANPHGLWQELIAVLIVIVFQWRSRQPLLSILAGTVVYVLLRSIN